MSGVNLPLIKVAHPASRLGDPATINIRGTSRNGSRPSTRSGLGEDIDKYSQNVLRPATAGEVYLAKKSPRNGQPSRISETHSVVISTDRTKPIIPIFGNQAEIASRCSSRPATSSSALGSGRIPIEEIERTLQEKMKTGYYTIKRGFVANDPEGRGNVNRESLQKILCNFLAMPLSLSQFNKLMMRMGFEDKKVISIEEFYAKFRPVKAVGEYPTWLDFRHRDADKMTASQVHMNLKEKVRQRLTDLSSILPKTNPDGTGRILKPEFRNALNYLGFKMDDAEFDKLWDRYDPENIGVITLEKLVGKLGVAMENGNSPKERRRPDSIASRQRSPKSTSPATSLEEVKEEIDVNKILMKHFRMGAKDIYHAFLEVDLDRKGKVNKNDFRKVFMDYDLNLTDEQIKDLLARCGIQDSNAIDYMDFLRKYQSRSQGGMTNQILSDPNHTFHTPNEDTDESSVLNIEAKLLNLFQKDFLVLLGTFRKYDKANSMTVSQRDFCTALRTNFGIDLSELELLALIPDLPLDKDHNVLYMEFIARFDAKGRPSLFDTRSVVQDVPNYHLLDESPESPRLRTSKSLGSHASTYKSDDGRTVEELTELIKTTVKDNYQGVQKEFLEMDEYNSKKLSQKMLQGLLQKFGVSLSGSEVKRVWDTFITNQDGTLEFNQFVRHFIFSLKSAAFPNAKVSPPKRGDSDFKVRSRKLNSDFHMLEDCLKSKIMLRYEKLQYQFKKLDIEDTGLVTVEDFKNILQDLCIQMTEHEYNQICNKFDLKKNGRISWKEFLRPFESRQQVYRYGNNMSGILLHSGNENDPKKIAVPKGLPSITEKIRERLSGDWRTLRRAFRKLDQNNEGYLTVAEFKSVLKLCSVFLDEEEIYQLSSELDEDLEGRIPYREFLNRAMSSMSTMTTTSSGSL